jgi:hypothetical protein
VAVAGVPSKITVVTLSFLAGGGDGYPIPANGTNFRYLTLTGEEIGVGAAGSATATAPTNALGEQAALSAYMEGQHGTPATAFAEAETPAALDTRIQSIAVRSEDVLANGKTAIFEVEGARLAAGNGDDTYVLSSDQNRVLESAKGGVDTVLAMFDIDLSNGALRNVENATALGTFSLNLTGSRIANQLVGNLGNNFLDGKSGKDTLTGGAGEDVFVFSSGLGSSHVDTITDFTQGEDLIGLSRKLFPFLADDEDEFLNTLDFNKFFYDSTTGLLSLDTNGNRAGGLVEVALIANKPATLTIEDFIII